MPKGTVNQEQNRREKVSADRDHPEQYPTEQPSLFDRFESERNVDPIPVEDLNLQVRDEKDKEATKQSSSSERKYHTGFEDK
ncbi:hypothetical protein DFP94_10376 [Fontibacillus phaseoli]|uniref:Uncharacterized protein n=1 Tax=Fontibacillus phaseoli TaxID=1416533 RepID=A0A369BKX6_9BACL|nr:hypothetical protein [Fontibacillus phaseoli]RCX20354.1 hypothetical protein DFP94_10376 [Fontibacillus phaseoli]